MCERVRIRAWVMGMMLVAACRPELPSGVFQCTSDDQCPVQFTCPADTGLCTRGIRDDAVSSDASVIDAAVDGIVTEPDGGSRAQAGEAATERPDAGSPPELPDSMPPPECVEASDCTVKSACATARCESGHCRLTPVADGAVLPDTQQVQGDCRTIVCDGKGGVATRPRADDPPRDTGDSCEQRSCADGEPKRTSLPDGQSCNGSGQCRGGVCSVCMSGADCTGPGDCHVRQTKCVDGKPECMDTGMSLDGKTCGADSVCSEGQCVSCVLGASCGTPEACQRSRISSCSPLTCTSEPMTGTSCGSDTRGNARVCAAGSCVYACPKSGCGDGSSCRSSRWDCSKPDQPPVCMPSELADGTHCADDSSCRAGACVRSVLLNGDFTQGLRGWIATGDASKFIIGADANSFNRTFLTTWISASDGNGDIAKGTVSQRFSVPPDALALRFLVSGGHAHVRLRNGAGSVINDVTGVDSNAIHVPVSWDLSGHRGENLTIAIEDDLDVSGWSFVAVLGFDVVRDLAGPLKNSQFAAGFDGWTLTGDAQYFSLFDDPNYNRMLQDGTLQGAPEYGTRHSLTSFVYDTNAPRQSDAAAGSVAQKFVVPLDASALRFNVHGGHLGRVELRDGGNRLYSASGVDDNNVKIPVTWDLTPYRGKMLELAVIDDMGTGGWTFISTTGFDLITSYNGP
jgi:hypothetical protein